MVCQTDVVNYLNSHKGFHKASEIAEGLSETDTRSLQSITGEVSKRCMQLYTKGMLDMSCEGKVRTFQLREKVKVL
jgi:hypothetical protein